jgi:hypothetical protein
MMALTLSSMPWRLWRLRYKLNLRDPSKVLLFRGITAIYKAVPAWTGMPAIGLAAVGPTDWIRTAVA